MPTGRARDRIYPRSVGVLGHGFLAEPVLQRLLRALPAATHISTYGRDPDLLTQLQRLGAKRAASPADLAARSEYVLVLLQKSGGSRARSERSERAAGRGAQPDDPRHGSDLLSGRPPQSEPANWPTKTPASSEMVDAPLSGTQASAARGDLSIVVGATPGLYRDALPVLELLGTCVRVGGVGSAQIANACEQYVIAATAMALSEAAVIAERAGLDLARVLHSWELSLAGSRVLGAARAKAAQSGLPARSARRRFSRAARSRGSASLADGHVCAAAGERARTLPAVGSGRPEQSGSDVHLPVPGRTTPRAPRSTGLASRRRGCECCGRRARAGSPAPLPARGSAVR